jgi:hypothetical protein
VNGGEVSWGGGPKILAEKSVGAATPGFQGSAAAVAVRVARRLVLGARACSHGCVEPVSTLALAAPAVRSGASGSLFISKRC